MSTPTALSEALRRCRGALYATGGFSLLVNLLMLTVSIYMLQVYDRVLASGSVPTLLFLTLIAGGALLVLSLLDTLRSQILVRVSVWLERRLAPAALARAIEASLGGAEYRGQALRDVSAVRSFLGGAGVLALFDAPWVPIYLLAVYLLHPLLGHVALAGAVLLFALAWLNDRCTHEPLAGAASASTRATRSADAGLRNAEVIEAMGLLPGMIRRWTRDHDEAAELQSLASERAALVLGVTKFVRLFVQVAILGVGAWLVIGQELTGGAMIAGSIIMSRALAPVEQAIGTWKQAIQAYDGYRRLQAFFALPSLRPADAMPLPAPRGRLTVENLVYALAGQKQPILKGLSFAVQPGEAIAIVGPSAAGKSTLARLLVGTRRPTSGTVRLDGADVFLWRRTDVGRHIGYLPQDVELFAGTVRDNVARLEGETADPSAVVEAARLAQVHDMVLRLERGYETEIGDDGACLSGGQRQRIALARALFGRPALIVLDEPNASLDGEGEDALNRAIAAMKAAGSAVVVIGHRPGTLAQVDKVLVLVDGRIDQFGPRNEIMERLTRRSLAPVPAGGQPAQPDRRPAATSHATTVAATAAPQVGALANAAH